MRAHTYGSTTEDCRPTSYSRFDCHGEQSSCKKQCPLFGTYIVVVSPLFFFCSRILTKHPSSRQLRGRLAVRT